MIQQKGTFIYQKEQAFWNQTDLQMLSLTPNSITYKPCPWARL